MHRTPCSARRNIRPRKAPLKALMRGAPARCWAPGAQRRVDARVDAADAMLLLLPSFSLHATPPPAAYAAIICWGDSRDADAAAAAPNDESGPAASIHYRVSCCRCCRFRRRFAARRCWRERQGASARGHDAARAAPCRAAMLGATTTRRPRSRSMAAGRGRALSC